MGLKELKSSLDLVPGEGNAGEFAGLNAPDFQKGLDAASQAHIDSLGSVPGGDSNSPFQDLDGAPGPLFQQDTTIASQVHESSLSTIPGGDSNSPFQDRGDGATPGQYLDNLPN